MPADGVWKNKWGFCPIFVDMAVDMYVGCYIVGTSKRSKQMANRKEYYIRTGDVFASNKTGAKIYIDSVSRDYAAYCNEDGEVGRALISEILALFHKAA